MERRVCAIDVGTTKICALIAAADDDTLEIIGAGVVPARGIERGVVVDVEGATTSIAAAVREAEKCAGERMRQAFVGISGVHISGVNSRGATDVERPALGVTKNDIERALGAAQNIAISYTHEILHTISRGFTLDGSDSIHNPLEVCGSRLEVEAHLVIGAKAAHATLVKCVKGAGVEVNNLVVESLASAEAVLSVDERDCGVVLVDMGGGTTDVAIFLSGSIWHSAVIGRGGYLVTRDLSQILGMPFHQAELLKLHYGHAEPADIGEGEMAPIAGFGDQPRREVQRLFISRIMEARLEQIFLQVAEEIKRSSFLGLLPAGVVLCGGTAQTSGIRSLAKRTLGLPVRIGAPQGIQGLPAGMANPAYACSAGLLQWGLAYDQTRASDGEANQAPAAKGIWEFLKRLLPG